MQRFQPTLPSVFTHVFSSFSFFFLPTIPEPSLQRDHETQQPKKKPKLKTITAGFRTWTGTFHHVALSSKAIPFCYYFNITTTTTTSCHRTSLPAFATVYFMIGFIPPLATRRNC